MSLKLPVASEVNLREVLELFLLCFNFSFSFRFKMKWMIITLRLGTHFMAQLAGDLSKVTSWEEGSREGQGVEARSRAVEGLTGSLIQFAWLDTTR